MGSTGDVIITLPDFNGGGAERMCLELVKNWPDERSRPELIVKSSSGLLHEEFLRAGVNIEVAGHGRSGVMNGIRLVLRVYRRILEAKRVGSDVTVVSFLTLLPAGIACAVGGARHVVSCQSPFSGVGRAKKVLVKGALKRADKVLPISPGIGEEIQALGGDPRRTFVVPNCVETRKFERGGPEGSRQAGKPWRVVMLARLYQEKRIDRGLRVFRRYCDRYANGPSELVIHGSGPLADVVDGWVKEFDGKGEHRVERREFTDDVPGVLKESDCLLVTSDYEGFCNVIIEALAGGVPVVSTRVPYGPEFIMRDDPALGRLCDVEEEDEMARSLGECVTERGDEGLMQRRRERAREFDSETIVGRWLELV